jgi:hypothetical protein
MNRKLLAVIGVVLVIGGILAMSSFFIVDQTEQALVLQLGQPRRVIREPGLWLKRPFIENVVDYDNRVLDFEPPHEEVIVSDQKRLVADTYTRYRIVNPLLGDDLVEIFGKRHLVLGLPLVELDDVRQVLDMPESDIDRRRPDALRECFAPHLGEKTRKIAFRRRRDPAPQRNRQQRSRGEQGSAARAERHHHCAPALTSPILSCHKPLNNSIIARCPWLRSQRQCARQP